MIKEFRIGNLFLDSLNRVFEVEGLKGEYVYFSLSNGAKMKYNIYSLKPIPITEEWLRKLGYNNTWIFEIFGDNKRGFHIDLFGEWLFIESVHQLQNLYFSLCGEELQLQ